MTIEDILYLINEENKEVYVEDGEIKIEERGNTDESA